MQPAELVGVGVRFVPGVDHRTSPRGRRGHRLIKVIGTLGQFESMISDPARTGKQLSGNQERQQLTFDDRKRHVAANQIILMASEGVPRGIDVVLEHVDRGMLPDFGANAFLRLKSEPADHRFAGKVLFERVEGVTRFSGRILRM